MLSLVAPFFIVRLLVAGLLLFLPFPTFFLAGLLFLLFRRRLALCEVEVRARAPSACSTRTSNRIIPTKPSLRTLTLYIPGSSELTR